jgi:hypothetical protein
VVDGREAVGGGHTSVGEPREDRTRYEEFPITGSVGPGDEIPPGYPAGLGVYGPALHRSRVRYSTSDPAPMWARPARGYIVDMIEVCELTKQVQCDVFVRSPRRSGLARVLTDMGATVLAESGRGLSVKGMDACKIASAAAAHYIPIQELTPRSTSLGDAHL